MLSTNYEFDLSREIPLARTQVGELLAKWQGRSRPLHANHVTRLMRTGVRGVVLPSLLVGNRRVSSREACEWWVRAISAVDAGERGICGAPAAPLTSAQQATLRRHGITGEVRP